MATETSADKGADKMLTKLHRSLLVVAIASTALASPARADDKSFLWKLINATQYARDVIDYRTTDKAKIEQKKKIEREEERRNAPVGSLGIRG